MNTFKIIAVDTDSVFFKKEDETPFTEDEQEQLLTELNTLYPPTIEWELNGFFPKVLTLKAKNYCLYDGKTIKYKGSSIKSSTLETALKEFIDEIVKAILNDQVPEIPTIYLNYVKRIHKIDSKEEMKKWCSKKTLTERVYESDRANETKILNAIKDSEYTNGDKVWVYYKDDETLGLVDNFNNDYNKTRLLEKLYKTSTRFKALVDQSLFKNYKLKKNQKELQELLNA